MDDRKWILFYTDGGTLSYQVFDALESLQRFAGAFMLAHADNRDDYTLDAVVHGVLDQASPTSFRRMDGGL